MGDVRRLGWTPDTHDERDYAFSIPILQAPQSVYLASKFKFPAPYDQGNLGSCTAQAIAFLIHFNLLNNNFITKQTGPWLPSRLFIYYYERLKEGTINIDAGAMLRTGIKVVAEMGSPTEDLWYYDIPKFADVPTQRAQDHALKFQAIKYEKIDHRNKTLIINALMAGFPVCFGMYVYYSFFDNQVAQSGIVPMPSIDDNIAGGHAMVIVGYRQEDDTFIVRNSWGRHWGQGGYCRIPAAYLTNPMHASDFWVIYIIE